MDLQDLVALRFGVNGAVFTIGTLFPTLTINFEVSKQSRFDTLKPSRFGRFVPQVPKNRSQRRREYIPQVYLHLPAKFQPLESSRKGVIAKSPPGYLDLQHLVALRFGINGAVFTLGTLFPTLNINFEV